MFQEGIASSNRDIWADKASEGNGPEFSSYGGEDRDYRFDDEPYGDFDYRQGPPAGRRLVTVMTYDGLRVVM